MYASQRPWGPPPSGGGGFQLTPDEYLLWYRTLPEGLRGQHTTPEQYFEWYCSVYVHDIRQRLKTLGLVGYHFDYSSKTSDNSDDTSEKRMFARLERKIEESLNTIQDRNDPSSSTSDRFEKFMYTVAYIATGVGTATAIHILKKKYLD